MYTLYLTMPDDLNNPVFHLSYVQRWDARDLGQD